MKYYVMELQTNADGTAGNMVFAYDDKNDAEAKYHTILAYAAKSTVMIHAAVMLDRHGNHIANESFIHPVEPEPAPEETEE